MSEFANLGLGYRPDLEDIAHLEATQRTLDTRTLFEVRYDKPIDSHLRDKLRGEIVIENQQQTSSCGGHAASSGTEFDSFLVNGEWVQLSRWGAYITSQETGGFRGDNGVSIDALATTGKNIGFGLEALWKFTGQYVTQPPGGDRTEYLKSAGNYRLESWKRHRSYQDIALWAQTGQGPTIMGIPFYQDWRDSPPADGVLKPPRGPLIGYHALPILWPTSRTVGSRYSFEVPNSWGVRWANGGWCEFTPPMIDWLFTDRNAVFIGFSGMAESQAVARPIDRFKDSFMRR